MSSYQGLLVFLNVWATWCPPCREEMPSIARLGGGPQAQGRGLPLRLGRQGAGAGPGYVAETKPPMTMLLARGPAPSIFETEGIPATFLIAPDGRITRSEIGGMEWDTPDVVKLLEKGRRKKRSERPRHPSSTRPLRRPASPRLSCRRSRPSRTGTNRDPE